MGYKLLIMLMWLSVPAAALWLLRSDYESFRTENQAQLEYCRTRSDHLLYYSKLMSAHARGIESIESASERQYWETHWRSLKQQENQASVQLGRGALTLYPASQQTLSEAQNRLLEMQRQIERAAQRKDAYNKSSEGLEALAYRIFQTKGQADLYESIGALGVFLMLQEKLAQLEEQYRHQSRLRADLVQEMEDAAQEAARLQVEISRELGQLPDRIAADGQLTYRDQLVLRFRQFDPLAELKQLVLQSATAAPAP